MKKKLIAFDIYKTCLFVEGEEKIFPFIIEQFNLQEQRKEVIDACLTLPPSAHKTIGNFVDLTTFPEKKVEEVFTMYHELVKHSLSTIKLFPETLPTLQQLKQQGYIIAAVSNVSGPFVAPIEQLLGNIFDHILLSCKIGIKKPDRRIFELLEQQSGCCSEEILMIGDSLKSDIEGAQNAGIDALWINRNNGEYHGIPYITNLDQVFQFL